MKTGPIIPVLRIFDEAKAKEFYDDFLEFDIQFEHRFEENFPLFMGVEKGGWVLHLSEHHGDGTPGTTIRLQMVGVETFQQQLVAKKYKYANPGCYKTEWQTIEMQISDPFGNQLIFYEIPEQDEES